MGHIAIFNCFEYCSEELMRHHKYVPSVLRLLIYFKLYYKLIYFNKHSLIEGLEAGGGVEVVTSGVL